MLAQRQKAGLLLCVFFCVLCNKQKQGKRDVGGFLGRNSFRGRFYSHLFRIRGFLTQQKPLGKHWAWRSRPHTEKTKPKKGSGWTGEGPLFHSSSATGASLKTSRAVLEVITAAAAAAETQGLRPGSLKISCVCVHASTYACVLAVSDKASACHHAKVFFCILMAVILTLVSPLSKQEVKRGMFARVCRPDVCQCASRGKRARQCVCAFHSCTHSRELPTQRSLPH